MLMNYDVQKIGLSLVRRWNLTDTTTFLVFPFDVKAGVCVKVNEEFCSSLPTTTDTQ